MTKKRILLTSILVFLSLIVLSFLVFVVTTYIAEDRFFWESSEEQIESFPESIVEEPEPIPAKPESARLNSLFFGDIFLGRGVDRWSQASDLGYAYPFSQLDTLERDNYDAWIANLECPVTKEEVSSYQESQLLKFACKPEYMPEAAKWFDAFSLANNHTDNMAEFDGLTQTRQFLDASNIQYFGHYDNAVQEDICEIVSLAVSVEFPDDAELILERDYKIPVALCGYHNIFKAPTAEEIAVMNEFSKHFITISMPHQGVEYVLQPDSLKQRNFRAMIDNGADFVIGGHPHVVQTAEAYNGKLIVYSTGNTIFDQQASYNVVTGIGVNLDFSFEFTDNFEKMTELATVCEVFKDDCLDLAKAQNITKPEFDLETDLVATSSANKITKKGSEQDLQNMLARTTFAEVQAGLDY